MSNNNGKGREIFYGVIGVATLVVAIMGATFAYFTASITNNDVITGNAASIQLQLAVTKITKADEKAGGMIPMSNSMVHPAVSKSTGDMASDGATTGVCLDDNKNAVCQVYKITITNSSSAAVMVDGYTALFGGSGTASDRTAELGTTKNTTTMRWAQAFCTGTGDELACSTSGNVLIENDTDGTSIAISDIDAQSDTTGLNAANIRDLYAVYDSANTTINGTTYKVDANMGVLSKADVMGTDYSVIGKNYIRVSDGVFTSVTAPDATESYDREDDVTSALVYNQYIGAKSSTDFYIVVWLQENGQNQNLEDDTRTGFFSGQVKFISAQGSEVSATFTGFSRVARNT